MSIINVTFTGVAEGARDIQVGPFFRVENFANQPYTASFTFDVSLGVLGDHRLDGGLISASIDLANLGVWYADATRYSILTWTDDLSSVYVCTCTGSNYKLDVHVPITSPPGYAGHFQFGLCPTIVTGAPCGLLDTVDSVVMTPGPIAGSGLLGLLVVVTLLASFKRWSKEHVI